MYFASDMRANKKITPSKGVIFNNFLAGSTGFEPAISSVTGRRDNPFTTSPQLST